MTEQPVATLYLRSATHDDDSIAEQSRICAEHAAAQGWRVGEIFIDNGASGVRNECRGLNLFVVACGRSAPRW